MMYFITVSLILFLLSAAGNIVNLDKGNPARAANATSLFIMLAMSTWAIAILIVG